MTSNYDLVKIRILLTEGFSDEELRALAFDVPNFRPVYHQLAQHTGKTEIVSRLLERAGHTAQFDQLLAWAKAHNPAQYTLYEPYFYDDSAAASPYPGMQYFDVSDADRFFGRELLTAKLVRRLTPSLSPSPSEGEGRGGGNGPTLVVITLRADFYAHCAQYDHLREALARYQDHIGPMNLEELRRAIELPAQRAGYEFEPGLVDLILRDVGNEPGALPLLSHALLETWKRRQGHTLTLAGYAESGGVRGAIAQTAESVFDSLTPQQQSIARHIFLRLTELVEGTLDSRRRATIAELSPRPEEKAIVESVLQTLIEERLVTTDRETAEVAHEALIRE